jgi:hypothetical protein
MQLAKRERGIPDQLRQLSLVLGFGAIMGLAGPFGTYPALDRPVRYAFWIGLVLAGYAFALGAARLCELFPAVARAGRVTMNGLIALASAVPMTFVVAWTLSLVHPGRVVPPTQLPVLFACVAAVQLVIIVALIRPVVAPLQPSQPLHPIMAPPERPELTENNAPVAPAERAAEAREIEVAAPAFPPVLLARIPRGLGPEIVALEAEDHYVRVHTPRGSTLVLMRLSDAVELLDEALGLRVHRSWWVSRQAIASFDRDSQQLTLRLTNGARVPVGRTYVAAVRTTLRDS